MHKIFDYLENLDCFVINPAYKRVADYLGLTEWHEAVWIGRYFTLDNDFGEHWFDNWDLREALETKAAALGLDSTELFVVDPAHFKNDQDGPCHSPAGRTLFWKDVLLTLQLSNEMLFHEARQVNAKNLDSHSTDFLPDLEARIATVETGESF